MNNSCIRVFADAEQIRQCKEEVVIVDGQIKALSTILGLAGNEVRLKILYLIHRESKMCPCDLSDILNMTVPAISQHLKKLKEAKILSDTKVGQTIFYSIIEDNLHLLNPIFNLISSKENVI
jgi:DNA-binding transcriptional ArsR family regulator